MDKNTLHKECMGIVNQLFDLAEVPVEKRQAVNDTADKYVQEQFFRLFNIVEQSTCLCCEHKYQDNVCDWRGVRKCIMCGRSERLSLCQCDKPSPDIMKGETCTECCLQINIKA